MIPDADAPAGADLLAPSHTFADGDAGAPRGDVAVYLEADVKAQSLHAPALLKLNERELLKAWYTSKSNLCKPHDPTGLADI